MGLLNAIEACGGITEVLVACSCLLLRRDRKKWQGQQQNVKANYKMSLLTFWTRIALIVAL